MFSKVHFHKLVLIGWKCEIFYWQIDFEVFQALTLFKVFQALKDDLWNSLFVTEIEKSLCSLYDVYRVVMELRWP